MQAHSDLKARVALVIYVLVCVISGVLAGCLVEPTAAADVPAYNQQIIALLSPFVTPACGILLAIAYWIKSNADKKDLKETAKKEAEKVAVTAQLAASQLANQTEVARNSVLTKLDESHRESAAAMREANDTNTKILKLQESAAPRGQRSTDAKTGA